MSACQRSPSIFTRGWRSEVLGEAQSAVLAAPLAPPEAARVGPVRHRCHLLDERFGSSHLSPGMVRAGATLVTLGVLVATGVAAIRSSEKPTAMPSETDRPLLEGAADGEGRFPSAVSSLPNASATHDARRPGPGDGELIQHSRRRYIPGRSHRMPAFGQMLSTPQIRSLGAHIRRLCRSS